MEVRLSTQDALQSIALLMERGEVMEAAVQMVCVVKRVVRLTDDDEQDAFLKLVSVMGRLDWSRPSCALGYCTRTVRFMKMKSRVSRGRKDETLRLWLTSNSNKTVREVKVISNDPDVLAVIRASEEDTYGRGLISSAARLAGVSRKTLWSRLTKSSHDLSDHLEVRETELR